MKTNVTAKIKDLKFGVKEDVITLTIDGNIKDEQVSILRQIKKTGVAFISFSNSQLDFDDVEKEEPNRGIPYTVVDGAVQVEKEEGEQAALIVEGDEIKPPLDPMANVTDIRSPRVTKKEKEEAAAKLAEEARIEAEPKTEEDPDTLPF